MDFVRERGEATIVPYPKASATVIEAGDALVLASGLIVKAAASAVPSTIVGIAQDTISAADAKTIINVDTPNGLQDEYRAQVGTGTALSTMVGSRYDLDADGLVDVTAQTKGVVQIVRFISASEVIVKFVAETKEVDT